MCSPWNDFPNYIINGMTRYYVTSILVLTILFTAFLKSGVKQHALPSNFKKVRVNAVQMKTPQNSHYLLDRVIVKLRPIQLSKAKQSFGVSSLDQFARQYGVQSVNEIFPNHSSPVQSGRVDLTRFYVMRYSHAIDPFSVAKEFSQRPEVEYAEPWFTYEVDATPPVTPNDTLYTDQWALKTIKADSAWGVTQGDTTVILAIVDNAIQWDHPDLQQNIWYNPGEMGLDAHGNDKRFNGIDDDGDGYVDDWHGWDFAGADFNNPSQDNNPEPTGTNNTHGTHIAGIASAATNNITGIAGVGFNCRILPVKVGADNDYSGADGSALIIEGFPGIVYAAEMGAIAINCSWGGTGFSQYEQDIVNSAAQLGSVVIAAAGNSATSDVSYPAGYDNVISVAATNFHDIKTSYSSYGSTVDLCAPGGDGATLAREILSTFYPSTYAIEAGTSQATPHVTGLAGLVKSMFPGYSGLQVGEQIRVTCDDISGLNSGFYQQLGKGRINALRAVTGSSPAIRITSVAIDDSAGGNNNKVPEPNETVNLVTTFTNYLQPTSSAATVTMVTPDTMVQILNGAFPLGTVNMLQSDTASGPAFQIKINPSVSPDHIVNFTFNISDGSYNDYQVISIAINPSYATQSINNIKVTFTNNGRIGFNDFDNNTQGVGFVYANGNQLYEGGLMIGSSSTKLVDVVRNDALAQDGDFLSRDVFSFQTPGTFSDQDGMTVFSDSSAPLANKIGLKINMSSYAFIAPTDKDYVLIRYDIKNISSTNVSDLYTGLFTDWDILPPGTASSNYYNNNKTSYDVSRQTGYAWYDTNVTSTYCGVRALTGPGDYYGLTVDSASGTRAMKWGWMTSGIHLMNSTNDIDFVVSSGPYNIPIGSTQTVGFALIGGNGLTAFQAHADAAYTKWQEILGLVLGRPQFSISIHQNPAFTSYADLYVISDSTLVAVPTMTIDNGTATKDIVLLTQLSQDTIVYSVYKGSYHFSSAGIKTIEVTAQTVGGTDTVVDRSFQAVLAKPGLAQTVQDPERRATVSIPSTAVSEETYFLAYANDNQISDPKFYSRTYSFGPEKEFTSPLNISFTYTGISQFAGKEKYLHIFRHDGNRWISLDSWVNLRQQLVQANTTVLGEFALGLDASSPVQLLPEDFVLYQNYPNPFNPQTNIRYAMPLDGHVRLRIFNLLGQQVQSLLDEYQNPGIHEIVWDGKNGEGVPIATGLYVYRLEVVRGNNILFTSSQKMLMIK
jgi:serine protease